MANLLESKKILFILAYFILIFNLKSVTNQNKSKKYVLKNGSILAILATVPYSVYFSATLSCYCARNKNKNIAKCHPSILSLTSFTVSYMSWFLVDFSICHAMLVATLIQYLPLNIFFLVLKVLNYWRQFFCRVSPFN